jgi:hypothetical protein
MQLSLLDLEESTSSPAGFPARTCQQQESERASRALDPASGPKLSELRLRHDQLGASLRMSLGLELSALTGCSLTWQRSTTPHGRSWWVLSMPERRTDDNGCGLLPTPDANDDNKSVEAHLRMKANMLGGPRSKITSLSVMARGGLLPTPTHADAKASGSRNTIQSKAHPGVSLTDWVNQDGGSGRMLPTPDANCWKDASDPAHRRGQLTAARFTNPTGSDGAMRQVPRFLPTPKAGNPGSRPNGKGGKILAEEVGATRTAQRLNPEFVAWMMGFPPGWLDVECPRSERSATPSSRRSRLNYSEPSRA